MEKSEQINELITALSKAQGIIIPASKDSDNPFFKSKYADLAAVWEVARDPLYKNGLSVIQHPSAEGNIVTVETILAHSSGQWMSSKLNMTAKDSSPQAIGSCITYLRRYTLSSIVGIASEIDDDGNAATHLMPKKQPDVTKHIGLKERVTGTGIAKFGDEDIFKAWRIENNLVENLDKATDVELNYVITVLREYKPGSKKQE